MIERPLGISPRVRRSVRVLSQGHDQAVEDVGLRNDAIGEGEAGHDLPQYQCTAEDHVPSPRGEAASAAPLGNRFGAEDMAPTSDRRRGQHRVVDPLPVVVLQPQFQRSQRRDGTGQTDELHGPAFLCQ